MTGSRHADLVAASEAMLSGLLPVDRAALTTFSHAAMPGIPLTGDLDAVREALRSFTPSGLTAVMDGVYVALTTTLAQSGRSPVVVCTDGSDVSSWLRPDDVIESAKRSNAVIYAVASADARSVASLEELTELTGGGMIRVAKSTLTSAVRLTGSCGSSAAATFCRTRPLASRWAVGTGSTFASNGAG